MQQEIWEAIQRALEEFGVVDAAFVVEKPNDLSHGDYATNAALVAAKELGKSPKEVAEMLQKKLASEKVLGSPVSPEAARGPDYFLQQVSSSAIERIEIAGPGFINFFLTQEAILKEVVKASNGDFAALPSDMAGQTVMVEYTQPNPFKEFHIGHLMSNTTGESIARILEAVGATVIRANYQGDVGPHVAKALYVLLQQGESAPSVQAISAAYVTGSKLYEEDLAEKDAIDQLNKKIYQQYGEVTDQKLWDLYQYGRTITLQHFEELYRMLGTTFDFYFFESETSVPGLAVVLSHPEIFQESEGAMVFHGEDYGLHTRVFVNRLGLPTYETKDLGLAELKKQKANFDLSITETAKEQDEYFKVVFQALEIVHPEWKGQFTHISHGMMRFAEGKMSSRRGNVITGESLLMDLKEAAEEKMEGRELQDHEKTAEEVAVGAIKYAVLKQGRGKDIIFDPEKSLSLEGDSGPYIQYAYTRAQSLLRAAKKAGVMGDTSNVSEVGSLERTILHFGEVTARAATELEPHYITTYVTELSSLFNSWYANSRVIGGEHPQYGVLLTQAFACTMEKGLYLLGIPAPEEM